MITIAKWAAFLCSVILLLVAVWIEGRTNSLILSCSAAIIAVMGIILMELENIKNKL